MANIKSKEKRIKTNEKARARNAAIKSQVRKAIKNAKLAAEQKAENLDEKIKLAHQLINKSVSKGVFHKNNAARKSSRLDAFVARTKTSQI